MNIKTTNSAATSQPLASPPILLCDHPAKRLYFLENGTKHPFRDIPPPYFASLLNRLNANPRARALLDARGISPTRKVELFTFFSLKDSMLKTN